MLHLSVMASLLDSVRGHVDQSSVILPREACYNIPCLKSLLGWAHLMLPQEPNIFPMFSLDNMGYAGDWTYQLYLMQNYHIMGT